MREKILERLQDIETKEGVSILYAVESGSRAWGFESPDSDYDVRFIYLRPMPWYLKLEKRREVLEYPIDKVWDVNGWDLQKALRLLHSSNPTLIEWLHSPEVYRTSPLMKELCGVSEKYFRKRACLNHYLNMAQNNLKACLSGGGVRTKRYFYILRPILACWWILEKGTPPPVLFSALWESQLPAALRPEVERLLEEKRAAAESSQTEHIKELDQYAEESIEKISREIQQMPKEEDPGWDVLNALFARAIGWKEAEV